MFRLLKSKRGFTLVEIIVSIAILGIIVTPLSSLFLSSIKNNASAKEKEIANHLAQQYMERAMMQPLNYIGRLDNNIEGDFVVKVNGTEQIRSSDYGLSETTGGTSLPDFDLVVDFDDVEMGSVESGDTLDVIVDSSYVKIKEGSIDIYNESYDILNGEINIKINCEDDTDISLEVSNNSDKRLNIYKVYTSSGENEIEVTTLSGEVYVYENIYDNSVGNIEKNRVYKIVVTVERDSKELVKIVNFKTID